MSPRTKDLKKRQKMQEKMFPAKEWAWLDQLIEDMADGGDETRRLPPIEEKNDFKIPIVNRQPSAKVFAEIPKQPTTGGWRTAFKKPPLLTGGSRLTIAKAQKPGVLEPEDFVVGSSAALNFDGSLDAFWPKRLKHREDMDEMTKHWNMDEKEAMAMITSHQLAEIRHQESLDYASRRPMTRQSQKTSPERRGSLSTIDVADAEAISAVGTGSSETGDDAEGAVDDAGDENADVDEDEDGDAEIDDEVATEDEIVVGEDLSALLQFDRTNRQTDSNGDMLKQVKLTLAYEMPDPLADIGEGGLKTPGLPVKAGSCSTPGGSAGERGAADKVDVTIMISDEEKTDETQDGDGGGGGGGGGGGEKEENEGQKEKETLDEEEKRKLTSTFLPVMGALQVFGPIVLPSMEEIIVGEALKHYREGLENMKGTGYEKAVRCFNKASHLKPNVIDFYKIRSEAYLQLCDFPSAIKDLKIVISLEPNHDKISEHLAFVYYFWGRVLFDQHLFPDALDAFSMAAQMQPTVIAYQAQSFACLASLGRHGECLSLVNKGLELNNGNPDLYIMRARLHQLANRITECYYDVREALELDPLHAEALKLLRGIESRANEFMMAAVEMDLNGKWGVAAAKIALAIKTNPAVALFHNVKGALHRKKLEFNEAIDDYLIAIDKSGNPQDPVFKDAHHQLILTYNDFAIQCYNKAAYEEAVSLLNKAINAEKNEKGIYINRGDCFLRLEEYLYALADYRQALDLDRSDSTISPRISYIYYFYGVTMAREKCEDDAILYFKQAIQFDPLIGQFYVALATTTAASRPMTEARIETLRAIAVVGTKHKNVVPLIAKLFPGKAEEQILALPEYVTVKREVGVQINRSGERHCTNPLHPQKMTTSSMYPRGVDGGADSFGPVPSLASKMDFRRCEDDVQFFDELIEGRRVVNQTVKKLLRSRLPFALNSSDDNDASSFISSSHPNGASIAPLPPAKPFHRRAGGLPDILGGADRGGKSGDGRRGGRGGGGRSGRGGKGDSKTTTTSATSGVSAASTEWKTLVKRIHYRNVKKYTQV